jgi:hypothetical protein
MNWLKKYMGNFEENGGNLLRFGAAAGVIACSVPFAQEYAEVLRTLPWKELTEWVSYPFALYGLGEAWNSEGDSTSSKFIEASLKSSPGFSPFIANNTNSDFVYSILVPAAACIAGYGIEYIDKIFRKEKPLP